MELIAEKPGHAVWLRTQDGGKHWQAACHCGFRSHGDGDLGAVNPEEARAAGLAHAASAPPVAQTKPKKARRR